MKKNSILVLALSTLPLLITAAPTWPTLSRHHADQGAASALALASIANTIELAMNAKKKHYSKKLIVFRALASILGIGAAAAIVFGKPAQKWSENAQAARLAAKQQAHEQEQQELAAIAAEAERQAREEEEQKRRAEAEREAQAKEEEEKQRRAQKTPAKAAAVEAARATAPASNVRKKTDEEWEKELNAAKEKWKILAEGAEDMVETVYKPTNFYDTFWALIRSGSWSPTYAPRYLKAMGGASLEEYLAREFSIGHTSKEYPKFAVFLSTNEMREILLNTNRRRSDEAVRLGNAILTEWNNHPESYSETGVFIDRLKEAIARLQKG